MVDRVIELRGRGMRGALGFTMDVPATAGQYIQKAAGGDARKFMGSTPPGTIADAVKATDLAGATGGQRVGIGARSLDDKLGEIVSVKDTRFGGGAKGDFVAFDDEPIQEAIDYLDSLGGGTLLYPPGHYKTRNPINPGDRVFHVGAGCHATSLITGTHGGNIYEASKLEFGTFEKLAFSGPECTAIAQTLTGGATVDYFSDFEARKCHFYGDLAEGIRANLIRAEIAKCSSAYYGTVGASHRFLASIGTGTNLTNINQLSGCLVYNGKGSECVLLADGSGWSIDNQNNFEKNKTLPIRVRGIVSLKVIDNFFEDNTGTPYEIEINAGDHVINLSGLQIDRNQFVPSVDSQRAVQMNTTNFDQEGWTFDDNKNLSVLITNDFRHLRNQSGTAQLFDATPAALTLQDGSSSFKRRDGRVMHVVSFAYPENTSDEVALIGGWQFPAKAITFGTGASTLSTGAIVAMEANLTTARVYSPTLVPLTNRQLSGRTFYVTMEYFTS